MGANKQLDLSAFDGRLLDGLNFCRKVYAFFDQVKSSPGGIEKLRLLKTKDVKRLNEELLPISQYVQAHYDGGRRLKIRWFAGSQPYDAVLLSHGIRVDKGLVTKRLFLEVTTAVHANEHLVRELVNSGEVSFGSKGISRDKKTKKIISEAYAQDASESIFDLVDQILKCMRDKGSKGYPSDTILVINCVTNNLVGDAEWRQAICEVRKAALHAGFREVFLVEGRGSRTVSI